MYYILLFLRKQLDVVCAYT